MGRRAAPEPFLHVNDPPGTLRLELRPESVAERTHYSFVGIRQRHFRFTADVTIGFVPQHREEAGMLVMQKDTAAFGCLLRSGADGAQVIGVTQFSETGRQELAAVPAPVGALHLRIRGHDLQYYCEFSVDGKHYRVVGPALDGHALSPAVLEGFNYTGVVLGLYGSSNGAPTQAQAFFSDFEYRPE